MRILNLRRSNSRLRKPGRSRLQSGSAHRVRLLVEALEDRVVPSTVHLTNPVPVTVGFDQGLIYPWELGTLAHDPVSVVSEFQAQGGTDPFVGSPTVLPQTYQPVSGSSFAVLRTFTANEAPTNSVTTLSQPFMVSQGQTQVSVAAFFDAGDYVTSPLETVRHNAYGEVVLLDAAGNILATQGWSIDGADGLTAVGSYGHTDWTELQFTVPAPGTYSIEARASAPGGNNAVSSYLGIGNVQFSDSSKVTLNNLPLQITLTPSAPATLNVGEPVPILVSALHPPLDTHSIAGYTYQLDSGTSVTQNGNTVTATFSSKGPHTVTITANEVDGRTATTSVDFLVVNTPPSLNVGADDPAFGKVGVKGIANEGDEFQRTVTVTDPDDSSFTATVDYGDGTVTHPDVVHGQLTLDHVYHVIGDRTITVAVSDGGLYGPGLASAALHIHINQPPTFDPELSTTVAHNADGSAVVEGSSLDFYLPFTDTDSTSWTATVNYGDPAGADNIKQETLSFQQVHLTHVYSQDGSFPVTVTVTDDTGLTQTVNLTVIAQDAAPVIQVGGSISGLSIGSFSRTIAFSDNDAPKDTWTARVNFDSTNENGYSAWVTIPSSDFTISSDPSVPSTFQIKTNLIVPGTYTVAVVLNDGTNTFAPAPFTLQVIDLPVEFPKVVASLPSSINEGDTLNFALPFVSPTSTAWTATVNYGDPLDPGVHQATIVNQAVQLNHHYAREGTYPITVTVTDSVGVSSPFTFDLPVAKVLAVVQPGASATVTAGAAVNRIVAFTDPGSDIWSVAVDIEGTGTSIQYFVPYNAVTTVGNTSSFYFTNSFPNTGTFTVTFVVYDVNSGALSVHGSAASFLVNVFPVQQAAALDQSDSQTITDPGKMATVTVAGKAQDGTATKVAAALDGSVGASVFAGSYKSDPTGTQTDVNGHNLIKISGADGTNAAPTAYFDLRTAGINANAVLSSTFTVEIDPSESTDSIKVYYNDGTNWLPVQPDSAISRKIIGFDKATGKNIVEVTVTYTKDTTPSIFHLQGTVFTVALPAPQTTTTTTTVTTTVATLTAAPPTTSLTTSFSSDSGGTFVLRVSQGTDLSNSRTEASTSPTGPVSVSTSSEIPNAAQLVQAALETNWYLRALVQPVEDANPIRPAAGDDQRDRPIQPMNPDNCEPGPDESVMAGALDAMFATQSSNMTSLPPGGFTLLTPTIASRESASETGLDAGWALLTAAIGIGQCIAPTDRKRKRVQL